MVQHCLHVLHMPRPSNTPDRPRTPYDDARTRKQCSNGHEINRMRVAESSEIALLGFRKKAHIKVLYWHYYYSYACI